MSTNALAVPGELSFVRFSSFNTNARTSHTDQRKQRLIKLATVIAAHLAIFIAAWNVVVESKPSSLIRVNLLAIDTPQDNIVAPTPKVVALKAPQNKPSPAKPIERTSEVAQVESPAFVPATEVTSVSASVAISATSASETASAVPTESNSNAVTAAAAVATLPTKPKVELPSSNADYLNNPAPQYPPLSKRLREQGLVLLSVFVSAEGAAMQVELRRSSGFERLDTVAIETVKRWKFVPGKRDGVAQAMWVNVPIVFELSS
jgi:protein TonB